MEHVQSLALTFQARSGYLSLANLDVCESAERLALGDRRSLHSKCVPWIHLMSSCRQRRQKPTRNRMDTVATQLLGSSSET